MLPIMCFCVKLDLLFATLIKFKLLVIQLGHYIHCCMSYNATNYYHLRQLRNAFPMVRRQWPGKEIVRKERDDSKYVRQRLCKVIKNCLHIEK